MNTHNNYKDLKYCCYCGISNDNGTISCNECKAINKKKSYLRYYYKNREKISLYHKRVNSIIKHNTAEWRKNEQD